jgi:predicted DCC family thiol-disulfide oxidoreductase YuxK
MPETLIAASSTAAPGLALLYDGGCPLCLREVRFLRARDQRLHAASPRLTFVDIDAPDYDPGAHAGISYREAMGRIHAITADGLYAPTAWPLLGPLVEQAYALWAGWRLRLTGRPSLDQLCQQRCRLPE